MSTKCPLVFPASGEMKKRKAITLEMKLKIITQHEGGKPVMAIAREFGLSQSTISTILKDKKRITDAVKSSASVKSTVITKKRAGPIDDMEKLLVLWMEDQIQKHIPLSLLMIQAKARSLFKMLKQHTSDPTYTQIFKASHGWFQRFKRRHNFHNVKVSGEAASADTECAKAFKEQLHRMIVAEDLCNEELMKLKEERIKEVEAEEEIIPKAPRNFTVKRLAEAFAAISSGVQMLGKMDGNYERFKKVDRQIQDALACYREIYNEKKKQTVQSELDIFLKNAMPAKPSTNIDAPVPSASHSRASEEREIDDRVTVASPLSSN
ncbi:tigger transposable element-derived protein 1-like [Lemur catta]|uniref:tigger transposable element-derived protein 1-like n=1 Tax=Lemur catta TaxID=9447 RepID=UPI001E26A69D|nr:tigger transposable element-derived protein 1-like [Lemur catta]